MNEIYTVYKSRPFISARKLVTGFRKTRRHTTGISCPSEADSFYQKEKVYFRLDIR